MTTTLANLLNEFAGNMGFITSQAQLRTLIAEDRLRMVLVRCGSCRFQAPAQDVEHIIAALAAAGDYVRDLSLPASDPAMQTHREREHQHQTVVINTAVAKLHAALNTPCVDDLREYGDYGGVLGAVQTAKEKADRP